MHRFKKFKKKAFVYAYAVESGTNHGCGIGGAGTTNYGCSNSKGTNYGCLVSPNGTNISCS